MYKRQLQVTWQQQADQAARLAGEQARLLQLQRRLREAQAPLLPEGGLPGLLQDIAATGRGLVFEQVNVLAAQARAEYAEVPIQVRVVGDFSQLSGFVGALLGLPRRVTLHDLQVDLARAWHLPALLIEMMNHKDGDESARERNVRLAVDLARHSANGWNDAALPDDYTAICELLHIGHDTLYKKLGIDGPPPAPVKAPDPA